MDDVAERACIVYFVAPSLHFAGIERTVHEIATGLVETAGDLIDVHVVFASRYDEVILEQTAYEKHVIGIDRLLALPAAIRRVLAAIHPDVVVFPQVEAATVGWLASRGLRIPVFLAHLHGNPIHEESQGTQWAKVAFALFRHVVSRRIAGVLAVSPSLAEHVRGTLVRGAPVRYAPNPVRRLAVEPDRERAPGPFRFVSVGRLSRQKGQDLLLNAVRVARDLGMTNATVSLVGDGAERAGLERLAAELGVGDIVEFAGYQTDPGESLAEADCFVLASRWEGFGVVLVEALQYGLPLLATDCRFGPADIITDDKIGVLVPPDDAHALGRGLLEMATSTSTAADRAYRMTVAQRYQRGPAVAEHLRVVRELAADRGPGRTDPLQAVAD